MSDESKARVCAGVPTYEGQDEEAERITALREEADRRRELSLWLIMTGLV